jgi:putative membrane protein insertion efficiency factor
MKKAGLERRLSVLLAVVAIALVLDLRRPAEDQLTAHATLGAIHLYQGTLSPLYSRMGVRCRFSPSCSRYAEACVRRFGAARGGWLATKRVIKCGPWTPMGTTDLPPLS